MLAASDSLPKYSKVSWGVFSLISRLHLDQNLSTNCYTNNV